MQCGPDRQIENHADNGGGDGRERAGERLVASQPLAASGHAAVSRNPATAAVGDALSRYRHGARRSTTHRLADGGGCFGSRASSRTAMTRADQFDSDEPKRIQLRRTKDGGLLNLDAP